VVSNGTALKDDTISEMKPMQILYKCRRTYKDLVKTLAKQF